MRTFVALISAVLAMTVLGPACRSGPAEAPVANHAAMHDSSPSAEIPAEPAGAWGFSHYVFSRVDGRMTTTLVEGPRVGQVRCQSEALPCSYLDLKALDASDKPVPPELGMTRAELAKLVAELDIVSGELARFDTIDRACAEGYHREGTQNANMGIHMMNDRYRLDGVFDLRRPEMLLFGTAGGESLPASDVGDCVGDKWTGRLRPEIVGASYILPTDQFGDEHPAGFTGPLDNWHTHYHTCLGMHAIAILSKPSCEGGGGTYVEKYGWMIHVYAVPAFDNQGGVFAMWNPAIWPRVDATALRRTGGTIVGEESLIFDFRFTSMTVGVGTTVTFRNADHFFHSVQSGTVTAPTKVFASPDLYADQTYTVRFDTSGTYQFHCRQHPVMTGTVTVKN